VNDDRVWLANVLDAIARIERYSRHGRSAFDGNELYQVWMIHHLQVIGEAARQVSAVCRQAHGEVPWNQIVGLRNILVHRFWRVDPEEIWTAIETDVPVLKAQVEAILAE
jgi:uncharacterized protein with HEPN domain